MAVVLYNLVMSVLCGILAAVLALSHGADVLACLLIYSCAGQAAFIFLTALDLWVPERSRDGSP